ncbi:hypothetical protein L6164_020858 [Bauhinia variegata]|uniref:Uncharacterized protein n=1 Tax=Bauhinia variegata TaxID=167791 RepID=A0ACB9MWR2_BAUVA|nr:hypothetical protein L6164_020858 [Bauhinia variegata]
MISAPITMKRDSKSIAFVLLFLFVLVFQIKYYYLSARCSSSNSQDFSVHTGTEMQELEDVELESTMIEQQISCDRSHYHYDICTVRGSTMLDPTTSTFFFNDSGNATVTKIRPYPRKWENFTMSVTKELTVTSGVPTRTCHVRHESPALVFSAGAYTGNFFHDFNDGFIPLYITVNAVFGGSSDVVFVVSKARDWWVSKYADLLRTFSKHQIINLDNDTATHCFPSATLGLISHGFMTMNPELIPNKKTLNDFRAFLSRAYGTNNPFTRGHPTSSPRVLLINRPRGVGRALLNLEEVKLELEKVGFDVVVFEPTPQTPMQKAYALVDSSHAMIGIHGAALTHSLFLRPGSVFVQVVPLGAEWVSEVCFANPARAMGLHYMEYRIRAEESSLIDKYGKEDMMIKDPVGFLKGKPWPQSIMDIYLKEQNVRLDLVRFRKCLKKAYKISKQFMDKEG